MSRTPRIRRRIRLRRVICTAVVAVVLLLLAAVIADFTVAARAEHTLARALQSSSHITYEPEVTLGGFPFTADATDVDFGSAVITARGVGIGDCQPGVACYCDLEARISGLSYPGLWSVGPDTPLTMRQLSASTRLDSVNLGRLLNIVDLYLRSPAPEGKVGAGGPGDGLVERKIGFTMTGTVPLPGSPEYEGKFPPSAAEYTAPKVKVTVAAEATVVDGRAKIVATGFYTGPEEHVTADIRAEDRQSVLDRFSALLPPLRLPWNVTPSTAFSRGSDLIISGESHDLSPAARSM